MTEFESLHVTLHECFHAKQHEQVKLLNVLPEEFQDNALLYEAKLYAEAFNNYKFGKMKIALKNIRDNRQNAQLIHLLVILHKNT